MKNPFVYKPNTGITTQLVGNTGTNLKTVIIKKVQTYLKTLKNIYHCDKVVQLKKYFWKIIK